MKQIKFLMLAMMAFIASATFTACSSDDDNNNTQSNYEKYQQAVNQTVKSQKKSNKVILLVAFGSTWEQAYDTFDKVVEDYKAQFSGWDVYLSFYSAICINNARAGENVDPKDYYDPEHWLTAIGLAGYQQVVVQSLQVIPGEEYRRVRDSYVKDFMNNRNGDFTDAYMKSLDLNVVVGTPLMAEESDAKTLATTLNNEADIKAAVAQGIVAFMGHGNPEGYDYYGGNVRYLQLEEYLREISENYYVGTVDMDETYAEDVLDHIAGGTFDYQIGDVTKSITYAANGNSKAQLFVLMSIAGDHAHNDMSGIENEGDSWREFFVEKGFKCQYDGNDANTSNNCILKGLGDYAAIRAIWKQHTKDAEEMFAEEEEE